MNSDVPKAMLDAKKLAKEFIKSVEEVEKTADKWTKFGNKNTATVRRKSMDLSNALVQVRKPYF